MTTLDPSAVELRAAATVMVVRDGDDGVEVFMLRRNPASEFVGGAYVFPGGAVDPHDEADDLESVCGGRTDADASRQLGLERGGLAYWVAAVRECFEECGLLLAYDRSGEVIRFDDGAVTARFDDHRRRVDASELRLVDLCAHEGLTLACDTMHYFSHWITPIGPPRRYDTRFFVAHAPDAQVGAHDDRETVANLWVRPAEALERHQAGELEMIIPTLSNLAALARFDTAAEVIEAARTIAEVPAILPKLVHEDGGARILLPGDPGYDDAGLADLPPPQAPLPGMAGAAHPDGAPT
ncbi:MAG: NUDIX hydrolase [Acidimicrobiales bacterium]